jgi:DNA-binding transcriptional LysR family regulator
MLEWSDLRIFLAVAREGSTLQAARSLGLNQTTVSRRVHALEHAVGLTLFARRTTGYSLTEQGRTLLEAAERMERGARAFEQETERLRRLVSGVIRVTAPETMFTHLLAPILLDYRRVHPEVQIEQVSSDQRLDLEGGEADVAFRATESPIGETLIGQRLPDIPWTLYCSQAYAAEHGMPNSPEEIRTHAVLVYDANLSRNRWGRWILDHANPARIAARSNSVTSMVGLLRASIGVGLLPCLEGDTAGLLRCFDPPPGIAGVWWLLVTREAHEIAAVRRFTAFAADRIQSQRRFLRGLPG